MYPNAVTFAEYKMQESLEAASPWLNTEQAAKYAGFKKTTFNKLRSVGGGPLYSKVGGRVLYAVQNLDAWIKQDERRNASQCAPRH
jgi:hypothetical protein